MTPREFDGEVVQARLHLIDQLLDDLDAAGAVTTEQLTQDRMLRHAIERILSQLVDLAVSVNGHVAATMLQESPKDYRSSFLLAVTAGVIAPQLAERLLPSVGMRNVLAHEYVAVDLDMVVAATRSASADYRAYVRSASAWLMHL